MADGIESQNVVGYAQSPVDAAGMCPIGVAFKNVEGGAFAVSNKLFGTTLAIDDQVYYFNFLNGDWDMYVYGGDEGWTALLSDGSIESGLAEIPSIAKGETCYYLPNDWVTPATIAGEVEESGTKSLVMTTTDGDDVAFQFVNPYPKATTFADFESFMATDDQVYVFNTVNADWDMYVYGGAEGWTALLSDGSIETINATTDPEYAAQTLLEANRPAWFLPAWDWGASFPQSRTFYSTVNY